MLLQVVLSLVIVILAFVLVLNVAPKGWRTVLFNAIAGVPVVGSAIAEMLTGFEWTKVFDGRVASWVGLAVLILNVWLRAITGTPLGRKQ